MQDQQNAVQLASAARTAPASSFQKNSNCGVRHHRSGAARRSAAGSTDQPNRPAASTAPASGEPSPAQASRRLPWRTSKILHPRAAFEKRVGFVEQACDEHSSRHGWGLQDSVFPIGRAKRCAPR